MKTLIKITLLLLVTFSSYAQDIKGDWNGALNVNGTYLRIVFHVAKTDKEYKVTMDSPDQNSSGIEVTSVSFNSQNVKFEISNIGMVYEATLSGNQITGKWMQSGRTFDLVLSKTDFSK